MAYNAEYRKSLYIFNRVKPGQKTIRVAANSRIHYCLLKLSKVNGLMFASTFGLGNCAQGAVCQQLEICGWAKRSYKTLSRFEERRCRTSPPLSKKEKRIQKTLGTYPNNNLLRVRLVKVRRKRVMYTITNIGKEALKILNSIQPITSSIRGTVKGYKYAMVPIKVSKAVLKRMNGVW